MDRFNSLLRGGAMGGAQAAQGGVGLHSFLSQALTEIFMEMGYCFANIMIHSGLKSRR